MTDLHDRHENLTEKIYNGELDLPHRYVFVLTNICNLRCDFCFQDRDRRADAMTIDHWLSVVKQLPEYARVTLTGGEPLAFKQFEEIFHAVSDKYQCNMVTNGLLLNEHKIDLLLSKKNFKVISISVDDIGNEIRDVKPKQWAKMLENVKYFHRRKKELKSDCILDIKTVVLDSNSQDLFSIHKYSVEKLGANTHAFQFLKGSPILGCDYMYQFDDIFNKSSAYEYKNWETIKKQFNLIKQYNFKNKKAAFLKPKVVELIGDEKPIDEKKLDLLNFKDHIKKNFLPCSQPWASVHINNDGKVFPCLAVSMGNVREKTMKDIFFDEQFKKFKKVIKTHGTVEACNRCDWLQSNEKNLS